MVAPKEQKIMTGDIKSDDKKYDQGKKDFIIKSNEKACITPKMDHTLIELEDRGPNFFLWTALINKIEKAKEK